MSKSEDSDDSIKKGEKKKFDPLAFKKEREEKYQKRGAV